MTCRRLLALATSAFGLAACGGPDYGATFGYPAEPPVPPGTSVVAKAKGSDADDPMRGREVVIDIAATRRADLVAFYREHFPSTEGWVDGMPDPDAGGGHLLCLVNHAAEDFDEYVEVYPYRDGFTSAGPHRYRASTSRLYAASGQERTVDRCGLAGGWFPSDL